MVKWRFVAATYIWLTLAEGKNILRTMFVKVHIKGWNINAAILYPVEFLVSME